MRKAVKHIIFILFLSLSGYIIYLKTPYSADELNSPYNNAKIKLVVHERKPFWAVSFTYEPVVHYYEIIFNNKKIAKEDGYCWECINHNIIDVKWFKDSVKITFEVHYEGYDTIQKTYYFQ